MNLSDYKKMLGHSGNTIGQVHKYNSDMIMEQTWDRDIQSKKCYIYDYYHDDQNWLVEGMTYEHTTKTPIDAKFIIKTYKSLAKDQTEFYLQFRPSEKLRFEQGDSMYYFETDYRTKYAMDFPTGLYVDIPDDMGVYHKWLICDKEIANQFVKYLILPCSYYYHWIEIDGGRRIKRKMWGVRRTQSSYNAGIYRERIETHEENQTIAWLPFNDITAKIYYVTGDNYNQRMIMSAPGLKVPITWIISKVENAQPIGISKITLYQKAYNEATDYCPNNSTNPDDWEYNPDGTLDTYAMYADYFGSGKINAIEPERPDSEAELLCTLTASTSNIKVGGSYKTITATIKDDSGTDITEDYLYRMSEDNWHCYIDDENVDDIITFLPQSVNNKMKVRFNGGREYIGKHLTIILQLNDSIITDGNMTLEITT